MRGNHRIWGRQDYVEPDRLGDTELAAVAACTVSPHPGTKTWHAVHRDGGLIGYVSTRLGGQFYRTPHMEDWMFVVSDWNRADPKHAHAVLRLVRHVDREFVNSNAKRD